MQQKKRIRITLGALCIPFLFSFTSCGANDGKTAAESVKKVSQVTEQKTEEQTEATTQEDVQAEISLWDKYPEEYRKVLSASEEIEFGTLLSVEKNPLEWLEQLNDPDNLFEAYIQSQLAKMQSQCLSDRDRAIINTLLKASADGDLAPLESEITAVLSTGFDKDGKADYDNLLKGQGSTWYHRAIFMVNESYLYVYLSVIFPAEGNEKETGSTYIYAMPLRGYEVSDYLDVDAYEEKGLTQETINDAEKKAGYDMTYSKVDFSMTDELRNLLFVYGAYYQEIVQPVVTAAKETDRKKREEEKKKNQEENQNQNQPHSTSTSSSSSGSKKKKQKIDPDDLDYESYYEDYKDEFDDVDEAWEDLLDNPDLWEDYY